MTTPTPPFEPSAPSGTTTATPPLVPDLGPSRRKRRRRRGLWLRRLVALTVLAGLVAGAGMGVGSLVRMVLPPAPLNLGGAAPGEPLNVLVIGVDPTPVPQEENERTVRRLADTVQVLSLDYTHHRGFVLAIPRDTRATLGKNGDGALGDALALGGIPLVKDTVEELTGLTINHYVWIDMDGAKDLVKSLGNAQEYLPKPVKFADKTTGLALDMAAGWHELSPEQTLAYAYHREPGGDLERLERQQMLLGQWQAKIHGPWASWWFSGLAKRAMADITTDLPKADFETMANEWRKIDPRDLTYALLPGQVSAQGEWLMSPQRWDALVSRLQANPGTKGVTDMKPTIEVLYHEDAAGDRVMTLADQLTKQGFQVVRTSNQADVPQNETVVVDRTRPDERSAPVLQAIDTAVKGARVVLDPSDVNGYNAQYTIKLGKAFFR